MSKEEKREDIVDIPTPIVNYCIDCFDPENKGKSPWACFIYRGYSLCEECFKIKKEKDANASTKTN